MDDRNDGFKVDDLKNLSAAADLITHLHIAQCYRAGDRRAHLGVLELPLRLLKTQLPLRQRELGVAKILLADEIVLVEIFLPGEVDLLLVELALRLIVVILLAIILEPQEHLPLFDLVALLDQQVDRRIARAGVDLHLCLGLKWCGTLEDFFDRATGHLGQFHQHRLGTTGGPRLFLRAFLLEFCGATPRECQRPGEEHHVAY